MLGVTATIVGSREIKEWAAQLGGDLQRRIGLLLTSYALRIEREAKRAAPVRANVLRGSIHTQIDVAGARMAARIGTDVHYAPHLEMGTGLWGPKHAKYEIRPKTKKALAFGPIAVAAEVGVRAVRDISISGVGLVRKGRFLKGNYTGLVRAGYAEAAIGKPLYRSRRRPGKFVKTRKAAAMTVVKRVIHPGISPRPFLLPPFERLAPLFQRDVQLLVQNWRPPRTAAGGPPRAQVYGGHRRFRGRWV